MIDFQRILAMHKARVELINVSAQLDEFMYERDDTTPAQRRTARHLWQQVEAMAARLHNEIRRIS